MGSAGLGLRPGGGAPRVPGGERGAATRARASRARRGGPGAPLGLRHRPAGGRPGAALQAPEEPGWSSPA